MKATTLLFVVALLFKPLFAIEQDSALDLYQPEKAISIQQAELAFWSNKYQERPGEFTYLYKMAFAHDALFDLTADIRHLKKAEACYQTILENHPLDPAPVQRSLAQNYISQHRFCDALELARQALEAGSNRRQTRLILCDLYGELGREVEQREMLMELADQQDFAYLIRLAKWDDARGNLPSAIQRLEQARSMAEASGSSSLKQWIYSNLGDFYGHAGKIKASETHYRLSLKENPADWYSMKGLAWIAYSHEKNTDKALAIIDKIKTSSMDPGIQLLRAEILEYRGDRDRSHLIVGKMAEFLSQPEYGRMYSRFLCNYHISQGNTARAMKLAESELAERSVPVAWDMLASALVSQNKYQEAQNISEATYLEQNL
ncbi:MAG: hypothetical protein R3B47_12310 [Bacteroidia bacterium]